MAIAQVRWWFLMVFLYARIHVIISLTDHGDGDHGRNYSVGTFFAQGVYCGRNVPMEYFLSRVEHNASIVLQSLKSSWRNTPVNWNESDDPCGLPWTGVTCVNSRVTSLELPVNLEDDQPPVRLEGELISEIGDLTQLTTLRLSRNKLSGKIPPSLGKLSKLHTLELDENQLSGPLPVSTKNTSGLDLLSNAKIFFLNDNKLTGPIPSKLFSSNMVLETVFFSNNQLNGKIPTTLGLVRTLTNLYLDGNAFSGAIPSTISNLVNLKELTLDENKLSGGLPDLSKMASLKYLDLSDNSFDAVEAPAWFSTLHSLTSLFITHGPLLGPFPTQLLSLPMIREVEMGNNAFNGSLTIDGANFSSRLQSVNLENNKISSVTLGSNFKPSFKLRGNPVCEKALYDTIYCNLPYSTSLQQCGNKTCPSNQESLSPNSCTCASPLEGRFIFKSPSFIDVSYAGYFRSLEMSLSDQLGLSPGSVYLNANSFDFNGYLQVDVELFPSKGIYFTKSDVARITIALNNHTYKPPQVFGANYDFEFYYDE